MADDVAEPLPKRERDAIVQEVRERIQDSHDHDKDNRREAAIDLQFLAGDQWPETVRRQRDTAGRPMLTFNRLGQFVRQVSNEIRQSDLSIKVVPEDDDSDPTLARIYDGLIRYIQYCSSAGHVFATAAEHQTACGIGWFRIETSYADDSAFDQEIRIRPVRNPLSVFDDPAAIEIDRSDAMWRAVVEVWPRKSFEAKWPGKSTESVENPNEARVSGSFFWSSHDTVRVAEYWRKVPYTKILGLTKDGSTLDLTKIPREQWHFIGVVRTRKQECHRVEQFIVSGTEVLEGPHVWPGRFIPIIPVIGGETPLEQRTYRYGVIRHARDSQTMYNFMRTATAEAIALQPKNPWLVTTAMIGKYKALWDGAHTSNKPYLPFDLDPLVPTARPTREPPPAYPAALVQESQYASDDMKATTGIYDAALGAKSNETAGVAIARRQIQGQTANFHFIDNLTRALEHAGRALVDLIPKVYDSERVIRLLGDDGSQQNVAINRVVMGYDGAPVIINDLSHARFDIRVTIGKGAATKRIEAAEHMLEFMRVFPDSAPVIADLVAKNSDWPGAEEIAERLHNLVPPQALADPDAPPPPPPPPAIAELEKTKQSTRKISAEADKIELENMAMFGAQPQQPMDGMPMPGDEMQPEQAFPMGQPMPPEEMPEDFPPGPPGPVSVA